MNTGKTPKEEVLTLKDYIRIHSVIATILTAIGENPSSSCVFFALAGASLIRRYHKRPAMPVIGAAFYWLRNDSEPNILTYAKYVERNGRSIWQADRDGYFHCWIECDGIAIDLTAPSFGLRFNDKAKMDWLSHPAPKMFQRPLAEMSRTPDELTKSGDFYLEQDPAFQTKILANFQSNLIMDQLIEACERWYRPYPKRMKSMKEMRREQKPVKNVELNLINLNGSW